MRHAHSIVVHRDEHGNAKIWVIDYPEDGSQAVEREIQPGHAAFPVLLATINTVTVGGIIPGEIESAEPVDLGHLAKAAVDAVAGILGLDERPADYEVALTQARLAIERTLMADPVELEREIWPSAGVAGANVLMGHRADVTGWETEDRRTLPVMDSEDGTDTKPLTGAE